MKRPATIIKRRPPAESLLSFHDFIEDLHGFVEPRSGVRRPVARNIGKIFATFQAFPQDTRANSSGRNQ